MKYRVSMKEVSYGSVVVEAKSKEEAIQKAEQEYDAGHVFWKDSSIETEAVRREPDRGWER